MCNNSNYSPALARTRTLNKSRERILHRFNSRMCLTLALDEDARIFHENWHIWIKGDFLNKRDESRKSHVRKLQTDAKEMKRVDGTGFYGWQMANGARLSAYKFEWNENRFVSFEFEREHPFRRMFLKNTCENWWTWRCGEFRY